MIEKWYQFKQQFKKLSSENQKLLIEYCNTISGTSLGNIFIDKNDNYCHAKLRGFLFTDEEVFVELVDSILALVETN